MCRHHTIKMAFLLKARYANLYLKSKAADVKWTCFLSNVICPVFLPRSVYYLQGQMFSLQKNNYSSQSNFQQITQRFLDANSRLSF